MLDTVIAEIKKYLLESFSHNQTDIGVEQSIIHTGLVDSISLVMVILFLEKQYQIVFEEQDLSPDNFDTILSMATLVTQKLASLAKE